MIKSSFKPTKKQKKEIQKKVAINQVLNIVESVKMISMYALRNQGYGEKRLSAFNEKFNEYMVDVSNGLFSLTDIAMVLEEETGLTLEDLKIREEVLI